MDANLVNPFIEATLHILETTASTKAKIKEPYLKTETLSVGEISGLINVEGDLKGTVVISFAEKAILHVVSTMFGEDMTKIDDDIKDAVGEIANMISGQATTKFAETGSALKATLSEVIVGVQQPIKHLQAPILVVPFVTLNGEFLLEVCFQEK